MRLCFPNQCVAKEVLQDELHLPLSVTPYTVSFYSSYRELSEAYWDLATSSKDYFLQRNYLQLLEDCPPSGMQFIYLLFWKNDQAVGMAYAQTLDFKADEHIRTISKRSHWLKRWLATHLHFRLLLCGNILLTGQHAYYFQAIDDTLASKLLSEGLTKVANELNKRGDKINGLLLKDIPSSDTKAKEAWSETKFQELSFQPNMIFSIPEQWHAFDDYLSALSSKYRVRYRRARKKRAPISCHELNGQQIDTYQETLYDLYLKVADNSEFCMTHLHPNYFSELKRSSPEAFRLWAYFLDDQIVGFYTTLQNGSDLEAHFLGLDQNLNPIYQLYLNMLYDLIQIAIENDAHRLVFSRTALAIKSSVGALAEPSSIYLAHPSVSIISRMVLPLIHYLEPKGEWMMRHPFGNTAKAGH